MPYSNFYGEEIYIWAQLHGLAPTCVFQLDKPHLEDATMCSWWRSVFVCADCLTVYATSTSEPGQFSWKATCRYARRSEWEFTQIRCPSFCSSQLNQKTSAWERLVEKHYTLPLNPVLVSLCDFSSSLTIAEIEQIATCVPKVKDALIHP